MSMIILINDNIITYISSLPKNMQAQEVNKIVLGALGVIIPVESPVPLKADATSNIELDIELPKQVKIKVEIKNINK